MGTEADDAHANRLLFFLTAHVISKSIYCAAELRIADTLSSGPKAARELADIAGCSVEHLDRLLGALATVGIFKRVDGKFHNTPMSDHLRQGAGHSCWPLASFFGNEMYKAVDDLLACVRMGEASWVGTFGMPVWDYFRRNSDRGAIFDDVMGATSLADARQIAAAYDFSQAKRIMDVGGGSGTFLGMILHWNPHAEGVVFELEEVVIRSRVATNSRVTSARYDFVAGDFFLDVPAGADLYLLRRVLHDWNDDDALRILRRCASALSSDARLVLIERFMDDDDPASSPTSWIDIGMMVFGGKERTRDHYEQLVLQAGLTVNQVVNVRNGPSLMEVRRN